MINHKHLASLATFLFACLFWQPQVAAQGQTEVKEATETTDVAKAAYQAATTALQAFNAKHSKVFEGERVPIHYLHWTDEGIPLVFLHGTYSSAHDFVRFAPRLIEAGYRPISVDWYGHGQTPIPNQPVSGRSFADDLKALLDSLGIEKAVLAGHSRGGMLSSAFYVAYPDQVAGLVLIDGGSTCMADYFASLGQEGLNDWMKVAFDPKSGQPLAPSFETLEELFVAAWNRFGKPNDPVEMFDILSQSGQSDQGRWTRWRQPLRLWLGQDNMKNTFDGMLKPDEAPMFFGSTIRFKPLAAFAELSVPVLILDAAGGNDQYRDTTSAEENERLQQLHPELVQHIQLPTGHFIHREKPDEFTRLLIEFQQQLSRGTKGKGN